MCSEDCNSAKKVPLPIMSVQYQQLSEEFKTEILANFKKNEIGDLCRNEACIVKFGAKQYEKINQQETHQEMR